MENIFMSIFIPVLIILGVQYKLKECEKKSKYWFFLNFLNILAVMIILKFFLGFLK